MLFDKHYILDVNEGMYVGFCRVERDMSDDTYSFWCCPKIKKNSENDIDPISIIMKYWKDEDYIYQEVQDTLEFGIFEFLGKHSFQLTHELCEKKCTESFKYNYAGGLKISGQNVQGIINCSSDVKKER